MLWRYSSRILPFLFFYAFPVLLRAQEVTAEQEEFTEFTSHTNYKIIFMVTAVSFASCAILAVMTYMIEKNTNRRERSR